MSPIPPHDPPVPGAARAATWRRYLHFWGPRAEADVDDELAHHIEMRARDYVARGLSEADARRAAARRLGDLAEVRAECIAITARRERRMTRAQLLDALAHDIRFAWRTLGRQRGWTAVAILTLALGIGANTAVFSVVNALMLHPLPYPDANRIAFVYLQPARGNTTGIQVVVTPNAPDVRAWREHAQSFEQLEAYAGGDRALRGTDGSRVIVQTASVLPSFAQFAGQRPLVGRVFSEAEREAHVVMLGEGLWRARYGGDPSIIGKPIRLDEDTYTVVGITPAALRLPRLNTTPTDVWLPLDLRSDDQGLAVIGRLKPGVSLSDATRELDRISGSLRGSDTSRAEFTTKLSTPGEMVRFRDSLMLLSGAVVLVLLIACGNVTHLVLARMATRERELAVRTALGATRRRLLRQLMTESLILSLAGCIGGIVVGMLGLRLLVAIRPQNLTELAAARMDLLTLGVSAGLALLTGLVVGAFGALQAGRHSAQDALKAGALSASQSRQQRRLRSLLVVSEMAVSTVLLVGAMLLIRSIVHLQRIEPGFVPSGLYSVQVPLAGAQYETERAQTAFYTQLAERASALPGVVAATVAAGAPPSRSFTIGALQIEGEPEPPKGATSFIDYNHIEPNYFRTMGMRLIEGSTITDTTEAAGQVVVNAGLARKYWPGQSALGRRLRILYNGNGIWQTIVGVAEDAFTGGLTFDASTPMLYMASQRLYSAVLIVRASPERDPIPTIRSIITQIDPTLAPPTITNVNEAMARTIARPRFTMVLLVAFTTLALVLAAVGLYGVMAYSVAQRTREIGIRVALGASRRDVARSVLRQGATLAVTGAGIGLLGARWGTKVLEQMLYGVDRFDVLSFVLGALVLIATALIACLVPMRRAVSVDPLIAIRAD